MEMRKIDWKGICELIAVLCTGMGLGMEICINKFSIDKIGNDFYGTFQMSMFAIAAIANFIRFGYKKKKYHVALLYKHKTFALRIA